MRGLSCTAANICWVVGDGGTIGKGTTDQGGKTTWKPETNPQDPPQILRSVSMVPTGQQGVKLDEFTVPDSGVAAMNSLTLTGSGFPEGNINPANVVVRLATECQGDTSATTSTASVASGYGDSKLMSFLLPSGLAPGKYFVSISDSAESDVNFESSNCSEVTVSQ